MPEGTPTPFTACDNIATLRAGHC